MANIPLNGSCLSVRTTNEALYRRKLTKHTKFISGNRN